MSAGFRRSDGTGVCLLPPLPRQGRKLTAFAIARILEVDPVVRIDAIERNPVARPQYFHENPPGCDLGLAGASRDVGILAGEFPADRIVAHPLVEGRSVVDVF